MYRFRHAARRVIVGASGFTAALLLSASCSPAWAQSDPFELPRGVNVDTVSRAGTPGLSEIVVDGRRRPRMVFLEWLPDGTLSIECDDARAAGIDVPAGLRGRVPLTKLPIVSSSFDGARQTLTVALMRKSDGANLIDLGRRQATDGESGALTWARLSYDLVATVGSRNSASTGGLFEAAAGRGNFTAASSFAVTADARQGARLRRLSSAAQLFLPGKTMVVTAGDMISSGASSQRPVRLGGLQIASDFSLRPDLVTAPLPAYTGRVAVPTAIDVIVGQQRTQVGQVQPGEFTVRNVPMPGGRGEAALVIRDALGRETVQNIRFYASPELLPKAMSQFGASMGWVRRRFGEDHDTYGQFAATGFYRRGLDASATVTASGEMTGGLVNLGARLDATIAGLALATVETRVSKGPNGAGSQITAALESSGGGLTGRIAAVWPSSGYRDIASALGDPIPQRSIVALLGYNAARMSFQMSGGRLWSPADPLRNQPAFRTGFIDASARLEASQRLSFSAALTYRRGQSNDVAATIGLTLRFGHQGWAGASVTRRTGYPLTAAASYRQMPTAADPVGFYGAVEHGRTDRINGGVSWRNRFVETEARGEFERGNAALRINARGALIFAGGKLFARSRGGSTFALVRTGGLPGLTIKHNHQIVGRTGKSGVILVDDVIPYVASDYEIDPDKIPQDVVAKVFERRMVVPRRTVGLVELSAIRFIPRPVRLADPDGAPLEMGTHVTARPSGDDLIVGFDGFVETNGSGGDRSLEVDLGALGACRYVLPPPITAIVAEDPPTLGCGTLILPPPTQVAQGGPARRSAPGAGRR